ncbi:uncharacterized protein LOC125680942 isoform X1 [Ostrea edulis]|uniref:uncharacterized protein LOC125680942 isoform X1 n=1 Tax=Ostrea edulis TaxID=37623 RepID=UPI0024AE891B|nr:uncharacterized protein LOC125680942 isoform X1 [Ostrea edulis]
MSSLVAFVLSIFSEDERGNSEKCNAKQRIWGKTTRDLLRVFNKFQDGNERLPIHQIRDVFNSIGLYPSNSQVFEMVQCAVEYGSPCEPDHITFGEFSILVTELQNYYSKKLSPPVPKSMYREKCQDTMECSKWKRKVFLGGSCNPTTWRQEAAIPFFKKKGITFYNPQVQTWRPELMEVEAQAKESADLLLFVIDNRTRAVSSMIETAYLTARGRQVIAVMDDYNATDVYFNRERISARELDDILRGRQILVDLIERNALPVFKDINTALRCAAHVIQKNVPVSELSKEQGAVPTKYGFLKVGELLLQLREAYNSMNTSTNGRLSFSDICLAHKSCMGYDLDINWLKKCNADENTTFSFEEFCCILAENHSQKKSFWKRVIDIARNILPISVSQHSLCVDCNKEYDSTFDIYLGGSCGDSEWRDNIAIPTMRKYGLSYANPYNKSEWKHKFIPMQVASREKCRVLLYVITGKTRSLSSMIEAGYYIGKGCKVVLCVQKMVPDTYVGGEKITKAAADDYNRGRSYLIDLASREGIQLFEDITEAVECAIDSLPERTSMSTVSRAGTPQKNSRPNTPVKIRNSTL